MDAAFAGITGLNVQQIECTATEKPSVGYT